MPNPRIIIHAGPEKCGSTSIQDAVMGCEGPLSDVLYGRLLDPEKIRALDVPAPSVATLAKVSRALDTVLTAHPNKVVVFSHEMLFKSEYALGHIARLATARSPRVTVVIYLRRLSDFLVSSYGQWLFRCPNRIAETRAVLQRVGIDPKLFWGVERHLIAFALGQWDIGRLMRGHFFADWWRTVPNVKSQLGREGAELSVGLLPRAGFRRELVDDFLHRVGVDPALRRGTEPTQGLSNPSFDPIVIEAVTNAIEAGHPMPGPQSDTRFLIGQSGPFPGARTDKLSPFAHHLRNHIDAAVQNRMTAFAADAGLNPAYVAHDQWADGENLRNDIAMEQARRHAAPGDARDQHRQDRCQWAAAVYQDFLIQKQTVTPSPI